MNAVLDAAPVHVLEIRTADVSSARRARNWLAWVLEGARLPQDTVDSCVLAVSELVTNAYRHTDSARILIAVQVLEAGLLLMVHDDAAPVDGWEAEAGGLSEHGRGLVLVRALGDLTIDRHRHGTTASVLIGTGA